MIMALLAQKPEKAQSVPWLTEIYFERQLAPGGSSMISEALDFVIN
jgi:hypothetical protein